MEVLNDSSLILALEWLTIANNALYTAIDLISQLILVSVFINIQIFLIVFFFSFLNEALPMLDHVAPTIGYGYPVHIITCVLRY
jgi:hypothetical protein